MIKKIWQYKWIFRSLIKTLYFNFHYLPFNQAIKLPILFYKVKLLKCRGEIIIDAPIKTGMIKLGLFKVSLYPNSGIVYENNGGKIIFKGNCEIGNNSFISIGKTGNVIIGNNFCATSSLKLTSYHYIEFKENVLCGWNCLFSDTDFHQLSLVDSNIKPKSYDKIIIGNGNWFAFNNIILKGAITGSYNVISSNSILNKNYADKDYCLLAGQPAQIKKKGIYRNRLNDKIDYNDENI